MTRKSTPAAASGDPAERPSPSEAYPADDGGWSDRAVQLSEERCGDAMVYRADGWPVRVTGAYLLGAEHLGARVAARRVDLGEPFCGPPPQPWTEQVWARPHGG